MTENQTNRTTKTALRITVAALAVLLLCGAVFAGAAGADPTLITDKAGWLAINGQSGDYILAVDLDFNGDAVNSAFISSFSGTLDGYYNGVYHTISNFVIEGIGDELGLIGTYDGTRIANLTLSNFSVSGGSSGGGLVGNIDYVVGGDTYVENVHVQYGNVTSGCSGGLIGYNNGDVRIRTSSAERMFIRSDGVGGGLLGNDNCGCSDLVRDSWITVCEIRGNGGVIGNTIGSNIDNTSVKDCKLLSASPYGVGGLCGYPCYAFSGLGCRVENCTIDGSYKVGGLIGGCSDMIISPSFSGTWVNYTWVNGTSSVGSLMGSCSLPISEESLKPQHIEVYSTFTSAPVECGADNSFNGTNPSIEIGSIIVRQNLKPGIDYGYGSAPKLTYQITNVTVNGTITASQTLSAAGKVIHVDAVPDTGYHFVSWNVTKASGGSVSVDVSGNFIMPAEAVNAGAEFTANTTILNLTDVLGKSFTKRIEVFGEVNSTAVTPLPSKTGFTFKGWNVSDNPSVQLIDAAGILQTDVSGYTEGGAWKNSSLAESTELLLVGQFVFEFGGSNLDGNSTVTPTEDGIIITLTNDIAGPVTIPDNWGNVTLNMNGFNIVTTVQDPSTGNGEPGIIFVHKGDAGTNLSITNSQSAGGHITGADGRDAAATDAAGAGGAGITAENDAEKCTLKIETGVTVEAGDGGDGYNAAGKRDGAAGGAGIDNAPSGLTSVEVAGGKVIGGSGGNGADSTDGTSPAGNGGNGGLGITAVPASVTGGEVIGGNGGNGGSASGSAAGAGGQGGAGSAASPTYVSGGKVTGGNGGNGGSASGTGDAGDGGAGGLGASASPVTVSGGEVRGGNGGNGGNSGSGDAGNGGDGGAGASGSPTNAIVNSPGKIIGGNGGKGGNSGSGDAGDGGDGADPVNPKDNKDGSGTDTAGNGGKGGDTSSGTAGTGGSGGENKDGAKGTDGENGHVLSSPSPAPEQKSRSSSGSSEYSVLLTGNSICSVTFFMNGHGSQVASQSVSSGSAAVEPSPAPVADGYIFDGWYTDADLTSRYDFSTPVRTDINLYAGWKSMPAASQPQPTQTSASPAPFIGILAGLGAAAVFFGMRRT